MKQQKNNNTNRGSTRQSEHFKFDQYQEQDQGKLFGIFTVNNDKNTKKDLFGKWEDYVTLESEQFSRIRESSEIEELQVKAQNHAKKQQIAGNQESKMKANRKPQNKVQQKKETKKQRYTEYEAANKKQAISEPVISNMKMRESSNIPPFDIPQISEVKKYENNYNRNSEKYLLDILEDKKKSLQKPSQQQYKTNNKQKHPQQENRKAEKKKIEKHKKQQPQKSERPQKSQKLSQKPQQSQRPQKRQKQQQSKKQEKPLKNIIKKETNDNKNHDQVSQKSKRVTIQDKGKIKFTTDSISGQFDQILPQELRYIPSTIKKIDHQILQQQQFRHENEQYEPMDIVDYEKERQQQNEMGRKKSNENIDNSNKITDNKVRYMNEKRKPPQRIHEKGQESKSTNKQTKNKSKSQDVKAKESKKAQTQKIIVKSDQKQKQSALGEQKRKVKKINDMILVQTVSSANSVQSNTSRPKRNRSVKLKYWQNEKIIYNKQGISMGKSITSPDLFLQILGFTQKDRIIATHLSFNHSRISIIINLKPFQKLYSTGINYSLFQQQLKNAHQYTKLMIKSSNNKDFRAKLLQFVIEDSLKIGGEESYIIEQEQTFSLQNTSDKHSISVDLILYKP